MAASSLASAEPRRPGRCNMRGDCGKKSVFSASLPCALDEVPALEPDAKLRSSLINVCGADFSAGPVCCTADQVTALKANLDQAEALISSCPACRNNFRALFCNFTCGASQSRYIDVTRAQKMAVPGQDGNKAVAEVDFYVADEFREAFFESCKNVKFGASNGFVMDLIGGGAKSADEFLKYLGDEKPLVGSPFQINFPHPNKDKEEEQVGTLLKKQPKKQPHDGGGGGGGNTTHAPPIPLAPPARACSDTSLLSRCACTDCPDVCAVLPALSPPTHGSTCTLGSFSCFTLLLSSLYALGVLIFLASYAARRAGREKRKRMGIRHRNSGISVASEGSGYERVRLDSDEFDTSGQRRSVGSDVSATPSSSARGLVGATGLGHLGGEDESSSSMGGGVSRGLRSAGLGLGGLGAFDALGTTQPRSYRLNVILTRFFYKLGLLSARAPLLTFAAAAIFVGLANIGWRDFAIETDPVKLWVAPTSANRVRKDYFDEHFGPFYRTQQVFMMDRTGAEHARTGRAPNGGSAEEAKLEAARSALSWERLAWWADVEAAVRSLTSPNGTTLEDVCFKPSGPQGACVTQSIMGYFQDDLEGSGVGPESWKKALDRCAEAPAECLPSFQQPLKSNIILGGIPAIVKEPAPGGDAVHEREGKASDARAIVTTWVVSNSLDADVRARAAEWEVALEKLLFSIAGIDKDDVGEEHPLGVRRRELGVELSLSTESSMQQELGSSSNTDVPIVILSYVLMFLYAALTLGGASSGSLSGEARAARAADAASAPTGTPLRTGVVGWFSALLPSRSVAMRQRRLGGKLARRVLVESKFMLGLFGILVVLASVSSAVGLFSAAGVKVTLIIGEVLPFLLLAVGVDNIFILTNEMDRQNALASTANPYAVGRGADASTATTSSRPRDSEDGIGFSYDDEQDSLLGDEEGYGGRNATSGRVGSAFHTSSAERAARALSRMGPSILLSATTQVTAFLLGAIVPMPAVRNFALYAAGSMAIAAVLQCTVFVAALALDADRTEASRIDCMPCFKLPSAANTLDAFASLAGGATGAFASEGRIGKFIRRYYAPTLLKPVVKRCVLVLFAGLAVLGVIGMRKLEMGLDQRLALPPNSYLRDYFNAVETYLEIGAPVYFVARRVDATQRVGQQALCGRFTTCAPLSLANTLEGERGRPEVSFLAEPASNWIDDFLQWTNPVLESCCRVRKSDPNTFCTPRESEMSCKPCFQDRQPGWNITLDGMPEGEEFMRYLRQWLVSPTNEDCPLGGQAAYSSAIALTNDSSGVEASHFRTYHTPLRSQANLIDALRAAERISADINERNAGSGMEVFAYSLFYVFFDQYLHLPLIALQVLGGAALAIFAITTIMLGSWRTGLIVTACVASALVGVAGAMGAWGIGLNALTLVNLSVCAAICVEFCSHCARAFSRAPGALPRRHPMAQRERDERAWAALVDVGGSVLRGITGTKLVGISVLAFTKSELLRLYYAKMWAALILLGAAHGLILLPVALSIWGGAGYSDGESESEIARRLARAQEQEYRPFRADDASESGSEEAY